MGTPKSEGKARSARSKAERRAESGSGAAARGEQRRVVEGSPGGGALGAGSRPSDELGVVTKTIETVGEATQKPARGLSASANSIHPRPDVMRVPEAPEAHVPAEPLRAREIALRPYADDLRPRTDHVGRLESASVLDAPVSLYESAAPPARMSWVLNFWVGLMLAIIAAAAFVAYREHQGLANSSPQEAMDGPMHGSPVKAEPSQAAAAAHVGKAGLNASPHPDRAESPAGEAGQAQTSAAVRVEAEREALASAGAESRVPKPESESGDGHEHADSPESAARAARRAARRAAEAEAETATAQKLASSAAAEASRITMGVAAPSQPILDDTVRDPRPNAYSIVPLPSNPYEADEALATGTAP